MNEQEIVEKSPMMQQINTAICKKKALFQASFWRYALRSIYACLFLTLGTAIAFAVAIKVEAIVPESGKIFFAFMFSWSLVMIIFLNGELGTSNMLYMTVGVWQKRMTLAEGVKILGTCLLFNLIGGVFFALLISQISAFQGLSTNNFFFESIQLKLTKTSGQIFFESIFANIVVNIAVLICLRMRDEAAKVITVIFIIYIFAFLGCEHVIANFPAFSLAYFTYHGQIPAFTPYNVIHNLILTLLGNYVGGGLIMGLGYAWLNNLDTDYLD
ncbi:formate/nitrite transporter family protein [Enterococcus gilvus]|uniref:formate/nitrite transporter family protein n=1 Tax=Enterococcus gilvus TaxID=160453 RepID=UPI0036F245B4